MGKKHDAMADLNSATEENSKYIKPYLKRAELYKDLEEYDKSVANYHSVKEINPGNSYIIFKQMLSIILNNN